MLAFIVLNLIVFEIITTIFTTVRRIKDDIIRIRCHFKSFSRTIFLTNRFFAVTCAVTFNFRFLIIKNATKRRFTAILTVLIQKSFLISNFFFGVIQFSLKTLDTVNKDLYMVINILYKINKIL